MTAEEQNEAHEDGLDSTPAPRPQGPRRKASLSGLAGGPAGEEAKPQSPDDDLFAGEVYEELSERQIFVGDEEFFQSLEQHEQAHQGAPGGAEVSQPEPGKKLETQIPPQQDSDPPPRHPGPKDPWRGGQPPRGPRLSRIQKVLAAGIVMIVAVLLYTIFQPAHRPQRPLVGGPAAGPPHQDSSSTNPQTTTAIRKDTGAPPQVRLGSLWNDANAAPTPDRQNQSEVAVAQPTEPPAPVSLKVAQNLYVQKEYNQAKAVYRQLRQSLPQKAQLQKDFLKLKMALCAMRAGELEEADQMFNETDKSKSHIVALMTNYHRISIEMQRKQYLNARKRAYRVIALIAAVDIDTPIASALRSNCYFLIAEAMTRNVLSLSDNDSDLPGKFWSASTEIDPFADLDNEQLQRLLKSGDDYLTDALLTPQIRKITHENGTILWSALCNGASIEEFLARFASNAELDVSWILSDAKSTLQTRDIAHARPVVLYLPVANRQQLIAAAAGQVGLLAQIRDDNTITVYQPDKFSSLSQHISLLCDEAVSLWQRFLLTFQSDERIANAHFALGLLYARKGDIPEAIAEHKLVANKFSFSSLAPYALLHLSKLKSGPKVKDFVGAKQDLEQLVFQYPDSEVATQAYVNLAEYTARAGLTKEATKIYQKVYNLGLSEKSQSAAALGAGKCFYQISDYNSAARWLAIHINLAQNQKSKDVCAAYSLLGKTYLALKDPQQACLAFQRAIDGQLPREEYVETVSDLINGYVEQGKFVCALDTLENVDFWQFSQAELVRVLLLKSKILQDMGLAEKAIAVLNDQAEYISDQQLKAEILFEIANCRIARGQLQLAREELTNLLIVARSGPLAYKIAIRLAEICSLLGLDSQVISVCTQLMDSDAPEETRKKAAVILAQAHNDRQNYDSAALALLNKQK